MREYWRKHPEKVRTPEQNREIQKRMRERKREFVREFKAEHGCAVCGESDPIVLDCHHTDPSNKSATLRDRNKPRSLVHLSWTALKEELPKCEVLCANCHRRVTNQVSD